MVQWLPLHEDLGPSRVGPIPTRLSTGYTGCTLLVDKREIRLLMSRFGFGLANQVHISSDGGSLISWA